MKPSIQVVHFGSPLVVVHGLGVSEMYKPSGFSGPRWTDIYLYSFTLQFFMISSQSRKKTRTKCAINLKQARRSSEERTEQTASQFAQPFPFML